MIYAGIIGKQTARIELCGDALIIKEKPGNVKRCRAGFSMRTEADRTKRPARYTERLVSGS